MQYELIIASSVDTKDKKGLNDLVSEKLNLGYKLQGSPGICLNKGNNTWYYQAVFKE